MYFLSPFCHHFMVQQATFCLYFSIFWKHLYSTTNGAEQLSYFFSLFFKSRFDPIWGHDLPVRGFAITLIGHIALGRTSLDDWSARRWGLYLPTHETDIHVSGGILTHNSSKRAAADPCLRPGSAFITDIINLLIKYYMTNLNEC